MENPWLRLPATRPFVLPGDKGNLDEFNAVVKEDAWKVRFDSLPEPFLGRPDAKVVFLNLNPGFSEDEVNFHLDEYFTSVARKNLAHEPQEYPFYFLDPSQKSPGHVWWQKRLGALIRRYGHERLAQDLMCVEYFPYHSERYSYGLTTVPSQEYGFQLVREAVKQNRVVIVMRAHSLWLNAVHELSEYTYYKLKNARAVYVSERNAGNGFSAICNALD
jgi:hypothetical protein